MNIQKLKATRRRNLAGTVIGVRLDVSERRKIQQLADKYTAGNASELIRKAALEYVPREEDFIPSNRGNRQNSSELTAVPSRDQDEITRILDSL